MARAAGFSEASASAGEASSGGKKPTLYHATAMARNPESGEYDLSPKRLDPKPQHTITRRSGEFVFAGASPLMAVAYSLKTRKDDHEVAHLRSCGGTSNGIAIGVVDDLDKFIFKHPTGLVFEVPNDSFEQEMRDGNPTGEWVSEVPVETIELVKTVTPQVAMKAGVQIFLHIEEKIPLLSEDGEEILDPLGNPVLVYADHRKAMMEMEKNIKVISETEDKSPKEKTEEIDAEFLGTMKGLIEKGSLLHLNREMNLNPIDFTTRKLEDMSYLEDPDKILRPSTTTATKSASALAAAASAVKTV